MRIRRYLIVLSFIICHSSFITAHTISLTPDSSLADAVRHARELRRTGKATEVKLHLSPGVYHLYEPLRLRPEDSGLTIEGEGSVISGGMTISGWRRQGRLFVADVPSFNGRPVDFRQMWVCPAQGDAGQDVRKAIRARDVSDFEQMSRILTYEKKNRMLWIPKNSLPPGFSWCEGEAAPELVLHQMWCVAVLRIKSLMPQGDSVAVTFHDPEAKIQFEHPWPSPMTPDTGHPSPFYMTNAKCLLDEPGEWYHDLREHKLYYMLWEGSKGESSVSYRVNTVASNHRHQTSNFTAVVPVLETLVEFVGTPEHPVRNITVRGIAFQHTTWMRPSEQGHVPLQAGMFLTEAYKLRPQMDRPNNHKLDNQGWTGRARAAVELRYAENVSFEQCRFEHLGGSGLDYVTGCHGGTTNRCVFNDIAMNGYVCGSFSDNGLETHRPYKPTDFREVCTGQTVENSEFCNVTNEDWGCVAIAAGYVADINITHNTIHDVSYTAISLGWGWNRDLVCMKNNKVHANLIYDYARHNYDCAGIYTLGNQPGTVISENVVRDIAKPSYVHDPEHWFYLYTDEGSSNITVRDNWTPTEKYLQNANGPGNTWTNNGPQVSASIKESAGRQ